MSVSCANLTVTTTSTLTRKQITLLKSFTARFDPGKIYGILGASGCGKTSLLQALYRCQPTESHQLWYASQPLTKKIARQIFAYLPQLDLCPGYLTVSEYLVFCAALNEPHLTKAACSGGVDYLLQRLQLQNCANVNIRHISGGQKRRVSICSILIRSGRLKDSDGRQQIRALLLDEPLTGLDSNTAVSVMSELKRTARGVHPKPDQLQRIILMSLHQPTTRLFSQLDYVVLLGTHQRLLFFGTRAEAEEMFRPSIGTTVAEIALSVAAAASAAATSAAASAAATSAATSAAASASVSAAASASASAHKQHEQHEQHDLTTTHHLEEAETGNGSVRKDSLSNDFSSVVDRARRRLKLWKSGPLVRNEHSITIALPKNVIMPSFSRQIHELSTRAGFRLARKPILFRLHALMTLVFSFVICLLWSNVSQKSNFESLHNRMGCLFFMVSFFGFSSLSALTTFLEERALFIRERRAFLYNVHVYVLVEILFDIVPLRILPPMLMAAIVYYPVGLRTEPAATIPRFVLLLVLANTSFASASLCIGALSSKTSVATFSGGLFMLLFLAFGGVFLSLKSLPESLAWMPYLTPSRFAYDGLVKNELVNVTFQIGTGTVVPGLGEITTNIRGDQILEKLGFEVSRFQPIGVDVMALFIVPLLYLAVTWCIVKLSHIER